MSPIIDVQNLSKKYKIGAAQPRYLSLRDSLSSTFRAVKDLTTFKKLSNLNENNEFWALKDINFQVNAGESIGIIGRNGAGKSTLLKILSRITPPTSGHAILRGRLASLLEVGTGFHPELTGRENVYFNGSILGLRKAEIDRKFDEIIDFSGVERFIDTPLKQYSSGMQLRLAFAVAAHLEPEILIIDEVLAVGDASFQQKCIEKMQQISTSGNRTIIFVSHNLTAVKQLCNRALLLENGQLIQQGSVESIIQTYNSMSILKGKTINLNTVVRNGNYARDIVFSALIFDKDIFEFGEKIGFTLTISKNKPINALDVEFGVNISDLNSTQIIHLSNAITHQIFSFSEENTTKNFYFKTETNGLRTGKYRISLFLRVNGIIQDWLRDVAELDIADGNPYNYNNTNFIQGLIMPTFSIKSA